MAVSQKKYKSKTDPTTIWAYAYEELQKELSPQIFSAFFKDIKPVLFEGNKFELSCNEKRVATHIKQRYLTSIVRHVSEFTSKKVAVNIITQKPLNKEERAIDKQSKQTNNYPKHIALNPNYHFNRFVKGPSNEHAVAACETVGKKPASYINPLYIYGDVGLGKTHLMMAIGNTVEEEYPWMKVAYTTAETFQNDLVEAVASKTLSHFKAKYRNIDLLLVDDIQFISARAEYTQEEIFHTFNYLYQNKKQIVISGDRPPQELSTLTDRLKSRFESGLVIDIKPPSLETRVAILKTKATELNLNIPFDVLQYIAIRVRGQIRVLEAALIKLKFTSEFEKHPIDMQLTRLALKDLPNETAGPQVTINEILRVVSQKYQVSESEIKGSSRVERPVLARHICMYLGRKLLPNMSLSAIAGAFGRKDHTTVMHAQKKIKEKIDIDEAFKIQLEEVAEELQF